MSMKANLRICDVLDGFKVTPKPQNPNLIEVKFKEIKGLPDFSEESELAGPIDSDK